MGMNNEFHNLLLVKVASLGHRRCQYCDVPQAPVSAGPGNVCPAGGRPAPVPAAQVGQPPPRGGRSELSHRHDSTGTRHAAPGMVFFPVPSLGRSLASKAVGAREVSLFSTPQNSNWESEWNKISLHI